MADNKLVELSDEDFVILFRSEQVTLGKTVVELRTLPFVEWIAFAEKLSKVWTREDTLELSRGNYEHLIVSLKRRVPELVSMLTGIHSDSVNRLPLADVVDLTVKAVEVNLKDHDFFAGLSNLKGLINRFSQTMDDGSATPAPVSPTSSPPSTDRVMTRARSEATRSGNSGSSS